ncbi:MAG TPA: hypothetical protein VFF73_12345 [Planctomycetota bacterium]|nr:hypothetical protein [Planctomycetota bacterium]
MSRLHERPAAHKRCGAVDQEHVSADETRASTLDEVAATDHEPLDTDKIREAADNTRGAADHGRARADNRFASRLGEREGDERRRMSVDHDRESALDERTTSVDECLGADLGFVEADRKHPSDDRA